MFEETFNAMVTMLMAKFMLNDVPHAAGLFENSDYVTLYHGTSAEIARRALSEGLTPQPGPESEFPSIYLAWSPVEAAKYGDTVLKVRLPKSELEYMRETLPEYMRAVYPIDAKYLSIFNNPRIQKPHTRYRVILEHRDPYIAAADRRSDNMHEDYAYAYSRQQAMVFVQRRRKWSGYRAVRAVEEERELVGV